VGITGFTLLKMFHLLKVLPRMEELLFQKCL